MSSRDLARLNQLTWVPCDPDTDGPVIRPEQPYRVYAPGEDPVILAAEELKAHGTFRELWEDYIPLGAGVDPTELFASIHRALLEDESSTELSN